MLHSLITDLNTATSSSSSANQRPLLSALVLHYDVAPWGAYPRQLAQAALLLNHALHALHLAPSHLLLGGDSAGGNLALALLSHLLHPHRDPAVPRVALPLAQKIRAVALISPWVSFDTETASFERNASRDVVTPGALARWATVFLGGRPTDEYNEPVDVPAGWWRGLGERVVGDVLFLAGEYEVLLDGILNCAESVRNEWARGGGGGGARGEHGGEVALVVVEEEAHVSCWLDTLVGFGFEELGMYRELREWLRARLLEGRGK
ncbi:Alpha/beta hydrolase fold-3 [Macrophomina phaseolina MS6]|uniref:Alpha/beta hydrolase fold-3 n=1 Tax=Macrophomina phaseolina (strain MS6) TaxID=1126212 RepID=K2SKV9_MACPH|nr:Alpha/beta hydrolase fold-3 [Macrophomina phaseolina MS6]